MKAIVFNRDSNWQSLHVQETTVPDIEPHQVLVKIVASGVNPIDWKAPEYNLLGFLNMKLPYIIGSDLAGIVEKVGPAVKTVKVGDEVFGALPLVDQGAFAEYAAIDEAFIALKPKNISFVEAAATPLSALTAWQGLFDKLEVQQNQKVLIQAAAGGVGIFAVQLAKRRGCYVVAIGSERNSDFLKSLGADQVFDYCSYSYEALPDDFDAVFDSMETSKALIPLLNEGGRYLSITEPASKDLADKYRVSVYNFLYQPHASQLDQIRKMIEANALKVFVDRTFDLKDASQALLYQKQGHSRGKNVLEVS